MNENVQHPHGVGQCDQAHEQIEKRFSYHLSLARQGTRESGGPIDVRPTSSEQRITRYVSRADKVITGKRCPRFTDSHERHPAFLFSLDITSRATRRRITKLPFAFFSLLTNNHTCRFFFIPTLTPHIRCAFPRLTLSYLCQKTPFTSTHPVRLAAIFIVLTARPSTADHIEFRTE